MWGRHYTDKRIKSIVNIVTATMIGCFKFYVGRESLKGVPDKHPSTSCNPGRISGLWRRSAKNDRRLTAAVPLFRSIGFPPVLHVAILYILYTYIKLYCVYKMSPCLHLVNRVARFCDVRRRRRRRFETWRTRGKSNARTRAPSSPFSLGSHKFKEILEKLINHVQSFVLIFNNMWR